MVTEVVRISEITVSVNYVISSHAAIYVLRLQQGSLHPTPAGHGKFHGHKHV
jgi:hypothetical protein